MFLHYAWHNDSCFPGQERLAADMGMSQSRVTDLFEELTYPRLAMPWNPIGDANWKLEDGVARFMAPSASAT